jgi:hypothetical protein
LDLCACAFHFIIHSLLFHMMLLRFLSFDVHLICVLHIPSQKAPILVARMLRQWRTEFMMGMFRAICQSKVGWDGFEYFK